MNVSATVGLALLAPAAVAGHAFGTLVEGEAYDAGRGARIVADAAANGGHAVAFSPGDWVRYTAVDFGAAGQSSGFATWRSCASGSGTVELRLDSPAAAPLLTFNIAGTSCATWSQSSLRLGTASTPTGVHDLLIRATGTAGCEFYRLDSFQLIKQTGPPIP